MVTYIQGVPFKAPPKQSHTEAGPPPCDTHLSTAVPVSDSASVATAENGCKNPIFIDFVRDGVRVWWQGLRLKCYRNSRSIS